MSDIVTLPSTEGRASPGTGLHAVDHVLRYWDRLRAGRPMPARAEIDPRDLVDALEYLFIAEPVAPRVVRMRLAGQHLNALLGMEPRGMPLCALFSGSDRDELGRAAEHVMRHGMRVLLPITAEGGIARPKLSGLLALMPLAGPNGRTARLLGVLQTRGTIGRTPRRLTLAGPIEALAVVPARPDPAGGRPQLRLIQGGLSQS